MPKNRQDVPREQRVREMVRHARTVFERDGFGAATMGDIAREAGVKPGAVYWYFPSKDDALAAIGAEMIADTQQQLDEREDLAEDPLGRVMFAIEAMAQSRALHTAVHERLPHSDVVAAFHHDFHVWVESLLVEALQQRVPDEEDPEFVAEAVMAVVDGRLSHERTGRPLADVVTFVLGRLGVANPTS